MPECPPPPATSTTPASIGHRKRVCVTHDLTNVRVCDPQDWINVCVTKRVCVLLRLDKCVCDKRVCVCAPQDSTRITGITHTRSVGPIQQRRPVAWVEYNVLGVL